MRHQNSRRKINQYLKFLNPILIFFLDLGSLISQRYFFPLQAELQIPPFKLDMSQPSSMFVAGDISQTILDACPWTPCMGYPLFFQFWRTISFLQFGITISFLHYGITISFLQYGIRIPAQRCGGARSRHAMPHRLQNQKWLLGGPKMADRV